MLFVASVIVACLCLLIHIFKKNKIKSESNLPPSLPSIPFLGSLPFISQSTELHVFLTEQVKKYGSVFAFMAGSSYTVVINGHAAIREALVKKAQDFGGRKQLYIEKVIWNKEGRGVVHTTDGEQWKKNRILCMAILKQFGYGERAIIEEIIHTALGDLVDYFKSKNGDVLDPSDKLQFYTLTIISRIMFSQKVVTDKENEEIYPLIKATADSMKPIFEVFPIITHFPPFRGQLQKWHPIAEKFKQCLRNRIETSIRSDNPDNFVHQYIQMSNTEYNVEELIFLLRDLFGAGTETVSTMVAWALVLLGNRSDILKKIQREIDSVVPKARLPSLYDKSNLPYLEATMLEVFRYKSGAPLAVPHLTTCDTSLFGYFIPTNTTVLINIWSAHMDPEVWKDPEIFRPERFLDENMTIINQDLILTFSLGKRACLGEVLARQETFLFIAALVQQFNILPPEGEATIIETEVVGAILCPGPYKLRLVPRL
jgi:cytochrome P450 family 2 subfamily U polypeptide 1